MRDFKVIVYKKDENNKLVAIYHSPENYTYKEACDICDLIKLDYPNYEPIVHNTIHFI